MAITRIPEECARLATDNHNRVVCGRRLYPNGTERCSALFGTVHQWTPALRVPYDENAQQVRDLGFEVLEPARPNPDYRTDEAMPRARLRYLRFVPGMWLRSHDGVWAMTNHARAAQKRGFSPYGRAWKGDWYVDPEEMGGVARMPRFGTPETYPVTVECPDPACGALRQLDAAILHVVVWPKGDGQPWLPSYRVRTEQGFVQFKRWCSVDAMREIGIQLDPNDETVVPACTDLLYGVAMHLADLYAERYPDLARYWQALAQWSRIAPEDEAARCLKQFEQRLVAASVSPTKPNRETASVRYREFARDYLARRIR